MKTIVLLCLLVTTSAIIARSQTSPAGTDACTSLQRLALTDGKITMATVLAAGDISSIPGANDHPELFRGMPAICRVAADLTPTADSLIKVEIWLPVAGWNRKFRAQGNGGFAGVIDFSSMATAIRQGYATAGTDTGHIGTDAKWALGHPEKTIDFGYRSVHEMSRQAKTIIHAYYGDAPAHSYFASCSDGGREALMEAQRFPEDYDGILAGAPANYWSRLVTNAMALEARMLSNPDAYIPPAKVATITHAVLAACDASDGITDGILNNPQKCHFDPSVLLCKAEDSESCLTAPQLETLRQIYDGVADTKGQKIFPGYTPGAEMSKGGWIDWITGKQPGTSILAFFGSQYFSNMVYSQPNWDYKSFHIDDAVKMADEKTAQALNATNPDLHAFANRGGKLILYHGWSDAAIPAMNTIQYYRQVQSVMGRKKTDSFSRLFLVPAMQHCSGGDAPNTFGQDGHSARSAPDRDIYAALERWVEKGTAPSHIIAVKHENNNPSAPITMSRPLCPFPLIAKYKGSGNTNEATNFVCAADKN